MYCQKCGTQNDDVAKLCSKCGAQLIQTTSNEAQAELTNEEAFKALIGDKNQDYYLNHFYKFEADGKTSATWHWPAFFVTFFWLLYRKMWLQAALYFFVPGIVFGIIIGILSLIIGESATLLYIPYYVAIFILPALYANAIYYKHCKTEIAQISLYKLSADKTLEKHIQNGGTSIAGILVPFVIAIPIIGILAAIAIPAYQDYTIKAKLMQTYNIEREIAKSIDIYYTLHQTLPANFAEIGYSTPLPPYIKSISINQENGTVVATLTGPRMIEGKNLLLTPSKNEDNIIWTCSSEANNSEAILEKYLPTSCK